MKIEALQKHIYDTVKEWQMKIGYREESMKLYYPDASLKGLLGLEMDAGAAQLMEALEGFAQSVQTRLGRIRISSDEKKERYCLDIPKEGVAYIAKEVPDSVFLKRFLKVITSPGSTLADVEECFAKTAKEWKIEYQRIDQKEEGLGNVFYFVYRKGQDKECAVDEIDEYMYCVESDDFGLTYHRFDREDYEKLTKENHYASV